MTRLKIDYGIDLGTTNSAICRMKKGEPQIIRTDVQKDIMSSCVSFKKKKRKDSDGQDSMVSVKAGDAAFNDLSSHKLRAFKDNNGQGSDAYVEFKRTMGTNTRYYCSVMGRDYSSEELSAEVLKTLKSFVTEEVVRSAVITVPAKFTVNQKTATMEAAKLAGFKKCELLQEPIAAAMAYGLSSDEKDGIWLVFDFGGGTFDAALLKVEDGIIQVFDTEGDNYLGGKNLDYAIVDEIIIPYLQENYKIDGYLNDSAQKEVLRDAMKTYAEEVKNQLSFKTQEDIISNLGDLGEDEEGEEIELDLTVTQLEVFDVMRPYFQKAVDICKGLLKRNNLAGNQISKLILVGGPTHSPLIRQMLREQITPNVDTSIDPMTAVAMGAALYASTIDAEVSHADIEVGTIKLDIAYEATTVESSEWVSVKLVSKQTLKQAWVELEGADKSWSSGKVEIDEIGDVIEVNLQEGKPNSFTVKAYDEKGYTLPCFPSEITIIQGTKVGAAPLPYNIGIAIWDEAKEKAVFRMAKGLEKNKPVPAVGVVNALKTSSQLRPGVATDVLTIPIYQVDDFSGAEGRSASLYEYVADVVITGDDVEALIPSDSSVDITLKVDASEQMKLEVYFSANDITVDKILDTSKKQSIEEAEKQIAQGMCEAQKGIAKLRQSGFDVADIESDFDKVREEARNSAEKKMVLQHLKEVLRKLEDKDEATAWERLEAEIREEFDRLETAQTALGDSKTESLVEQLRRQTDQVIRAKDVKTGRDLLEQINHLFFRLTMIYQLIGFVKHHHQNFHSYSWRDAARARQLLNKGLEIIGDQPTEDKLHPIIRGVIELLPPDEAGNATGLLR